MNKKMSSPIMTTTSISTSSTTYTAHEYMNDMKYLYNVSGDCEEHAQDFIHALFSYFMNGEKDVYPTSSKIDYINQVIESISFYDCRELNESELEKRQNLARYVANYSAYVGLVDYTWCCYLIAFILRNDLTNPTNFIKHQAEKLNVKNILFQSGAISNKLENNQLLKYKQTIYYYETTNSRKCLLEIWGGTTFYDEYDKTANYDISVLGKHFPFNVPVDYYIDYFVNLDMVRVRKASTDEVIDCFPKELLNE